MLMIIELGMIFQSTLPVKGATEIVLLKNGKELFQSTLPVKGATSGIIQVGA